MLMHTNKVVNTKASVLSELYDKCVISVENVISLDVEKVLKYIFENCLTVYVYGIIPNVLTPYVLSYEIPLQSIYAPADYKTLNDTVKNLHNFFYLLRNKIIMPIDISSKRLIRYLEMSNFIKKYKKMPHFHILEILNNEISL